MDQNLQPIGSRYVQDANENTKGRTIFKSLRHFQGNFNIFDRMYRQKELSDVTLLVDDIEIPAHKMVLAASSLYFYMKFSRIGGKQNDINEIVMQKIDSRTLLLLVDYMYTAIIWITEENVRDILAGANLLVLSEVQDACCNFLKDQLTPSNCLGISDIAKRFDYIDLKTHTDTYIEHNFLEVVKQDEFLALTHQQLTTILSRDGLKVHSEEDVFESVLSWVRQDQERRQPDLDLLMKYVRLPLLSPKFLLQQLDEPLLKGNILFKDHVVEVLKYQFLEGDTKTSLHTIKTKSRQTVQPSKFLVAFGKADNRLSMEIYDFKEQRWMEGPKTIERRWVDKSALAICRGKFYVIDGESSKVDVYNPVLEVWSSCEEILYSDSWIGTVVLDDYIYGLYEYAGSFLVQMYDPQSGKWNCIADCVTERYDVGLGAMKGKLYVVGGYYERNNLSSEVECYDPETDARRSLPSMPTPRCNPGVAALDGILYVLGGFCNRNNLRSVEAFNPTTLRWKRIAPMHKCRYSPGVAAMDGLLYVIGGHNNSGALNSVEVYDPKANTWTLLPNMKTAKQNVYATVMDWPVNK